LESLPFLVARAQRQDAQQELEAARSDCLFVGSSCEIQATSDFSVAREALQVDVVRSLDAVASARG